MKNNLLNKYLMTSYISAVLLLGAAGTSAFFAKKEVQMVKNHPENQAVADNAKSTFFLCMLVFTVSIIMSVLSGVKYPIFVREKVKIMTQNYLKDIFTRYPGMRKYSSILEDSKKVHEIAAIICNDLTEEEQNDILKIVREELSKPDNKHGASKIKKIEYAILDIVQAHAQQDPKYMHKLLRAISNVQEPNLAELAQKVR